MTMKLEQAARQAFEAMEGIQHGTDWNNGTHAKIYRPKFPAAITALREALAEPVKLAISEEAFNWIDANAPMFVRKALAEPQITTPDVCGEVCARAKLCYGCNKNLEEANAKYAEQAEQEPVIGAYEVVNENGNEWELVYPAAIHKYKSIPAERITQTFYAAPVRTKDLTDDEIADALYGKGRWRLGVHPVHLREYRRVIAADREKNR